MCYHLWRSGEVPEDCQKPKVTQVFKKGKEGPRELLGTTLPPSLIRWWSTSFWGHLCPHGWQEGDHENSAWILKANHAWSTWLLSVIKWPPRWTKGEQWVLCAPASARLWHSLSQHPHSQTQDGWTGWVDSGVDWWLKDRSQRVTISGTRSSWRPLTGGAPKVQYWVQCCVTCSSITRGKGQMPPQHVHWWHKPGTWCLCHKVGIIPWARHCATPLLPPHQPVVPAWGEPPAGSGHDLGTLVLAGRSRSAWDGHGHPLPHLAE